MYTVYTFLVLGIRLEVAKAKKPVISMIAHSLSSALTYSNAVARGGVKPGRSLAVGLMYSSIYRCMCHVELQYLLSLLQVRPGRPASAARKARRGSPASLDRRYVPCASCPGPSAQCPSSAALLVVGSWRIIRRLRDLRSDILHTTTYHYNIHSSRNSIVIQKVSI